MARKQLTSLDFSNLELLNIRFQNLATAPGSPQSGWGYYDTSTNALIVYNGTSWISADPAKVPNGHIPLAKLASDPLARSNHTGTQAASTISDFSTVVLGYRLDQFTAPTAAVSLNTQKITNLGTPTAPTDAANKQYVDNAVAGLSWKDEVRVATVTAGTLASSFADGSTIDGITLVTGDRILIKDQAAPADNGIYTVNASGAPTRATDADASSEMAGAAVFVTSGTSNSGSRWVCNATGTITLGTTALTFVSFGGGSTYTAGNGLTLSGSDFNVGAGTGITVTADQVAIDTTVVVRKYAASVGNGSLTSIAVTHSLNTLDVTTEVYTVSGGAKVDCDVVHTDANNITLGFAVAPTTNQYRVVVHG